eukprot:380994_1
MSTAIAVGDTITFQYTTKDTKIYVTAKVRYVGEVESKIGIYYGIELSEPNTDILIDNTIDTQYYFCTDNQSKFIKKHDIISILISNKNALRISVGDIVRIPKFNCNAIIRLIGEFRTPHMLWYGVQLEDKKGDNNGHIYGHKYFSCQDNYGSFLPQTDIELIEKRKYIKKQENIIENKNKINIISHKKYLSVSKAKQLQDAVNVYQETFYSDICSPFLCRYFSVKTLRIPQVIIDLVIKFCVDDDNIHYQNVFTDKNMYYALLWDRAII